MKLSNALVGEPAGLLKDLLEPKSKPRFDSWQQARRTGKLKMGGVILAEREQSGWQFDLGVLRLREIERVVMDNRQWGVVPDFEVLLAVAKTATRQKLSDWCQAKAPEATQAEIDAARAAAIGRRRMLSADECAALLGVDMEQRTRLGLRTIGAIDMPKAERQAFQKEQKRERDRARQAAKREAEGRKSRAEYEAQSLTKSEPWRAMGMSKRTYYRKGLHEVGTGVSPIGEHIGNGDTLVPPLPSPEKSGKAASTALPAMPSLASTTTDNGPAVRRAMGARGDKSPRMKGMDR